jgi:hypothetical protein
MDELEGKLFSIDTSNSFIFDLLRSKIYQDPILAICRELSCNARDANRVVNKGDVPIEVSLPSSNDLFFKVKDCGPGISPESIENIFIKYAASTKRDDKTQTGGFGLGAKTPFAYTDSFTVMTINGGFKYQYLCYIDETKIGKITLIDSHASEEPNGTTIIVPVKKNDCHAFEAAMSSVVKYWSVKPQGFRNYETPYFKGTDWSFYKTQNYGTQSIALIDGIQYNIDLNIYAPNSIIALNINQDDVTISPNRENLHLDEKTKNTLSKIKNNFISELSVLLHERMQKCKTLLEAIHLNCEFKDRFNFVNLPKKWNELTIPNSTLYTIYNENPIFLQVAVNTRKKNLYKGNSFNLDDDLYINDTEYDFSDLQIIKDYEKSLFSSFIKDSKIILNKEALEKVLPLKYLNTKNLSSVIIKLESAKKQKSKLSILKFNEGTDAFERTSVKLMEEDKNEKIICFLNNKKIEYKSNLLFTILKNRNVSFYGVDFSLKEKFEKVFDYIDVDTYIKNLIIEESKNIEDYLTNSIKYKKADYYDGSFLFATNYEKISSLLNKECEYFKLLSEYNKGYTFEINTFYESLYKVADQFDIKIEARDVKPLYKEMVDKVKDAEQLFLTKYPLINYISRYSFNNELLQHTANYIDLINGKESN